MRWSSSLGYDHVRVLSLRRATLRAGVFKFAPGAATIAATPITAPRIDIPIRQTVRTQVYNHRLRLHALETEEIARHVSHPASFTKPVSWPWHGRRVGSKTQLEQVITAYPVPQHLPMSIVGHRLGTNPSSHNSSSLMRNVFFRHEWHVVF